MSGVSGLLSDRFGRRKMCLYLSLLIPPVALIGGTAPSYSIYTLSRFMMGVCAVASGIFYVLFIETVGLKYRSLVVTVSGISFGIGYVFLALAAYFIPRWREMTIFSAVITLPVVLLFYR